jgi:next-to-BRCA1 protein 1
MRNPQGDFFGHEFYTIIKVATVTPPPADNRARFMGHETIDLWEVLPPGQVFEKVWRVRNIGRSTWSAGYTLAFLDGKQMGGPESTVIPYAETLMTVKVAVTLIAPEEPGFYRGYWKLRDPSGKLFGPRLPVWIRVA